MRLSHVWETCVQKNVSESLCSAGSSGKASGVDCTLTDFSLGILVRKQLHAPTKQVMQDATLEYTFGTYMNIRACTCCEEPAVASMLYAVLCSSTGTCKETEEIE